MGRLLAAHASLRTGICTELVSRSLYGNTAVIKSNLTDSGHSTVVHGGGCSMSNLAQPAGTH